MVKEIDMIKREDQDLREKDFAVEDNVPRKKRPRKTIGEEGSRKQTLIGLIVTIILGLIFYLPNQVKINWPKRLSWSGGSEEVIRIERTKLDLQKQETITKEDARKALEQILQDQVGDYAVYAEDLERGESFGINQDTVMAAASVIKFPSLAVYYQAVDKKQIEPNKLYVVQNKDRLIYGTGSLQGQPAGAEFTYQEIAELVGKESDNMGAQLLVNFLGGEASVEKILRGWGLVKTSISEDETTVKEMASLWKKIYQEKLLKNDSKNKLLESLTGTWVETRIPAGVPEGVKVRHKYGSEIGVVNDCGVVEAKKPYVICIFSNNANDGEAEEVLPKISRVIWGWLGQ